MRLAGATASALRVAVATWSYPMLILLAALATAPLIVLASFATRGGDHRAGAVGTVKS
jgi:hypothetical protein